MTYEQIQNKIDNLTTAAINAPSEDIRQIYSDVAGFWKEAKEEYMNHHTVQGEYIND
ncbi:MAG: hypothetical protein PUJ82_13960 [Spirochaetales bacterium]|nr:hypothetical protein [Spirochaetales bacterium]MDY5914636.1 hypothetical protein [Treponema sp.]